MHKLALGWVLGSGSLWFGRAGDTYILYSLEEHLSKAVAALLDVGT